MEVKIQYITNESKISKRARVTVDAASRDTNVSCKSKNFIWSGTFVFCEPIQQKSEIGHASEIHTPKMGMSAKGVPEKIISKSYKFSYMPGAVISSVQPFTMLGFHLMYS